MLKTILYILIAAAILSLGFHITLLHTLAIFAGTFIGCALVVGLVLLPSYLMNK